MKKARKILVVDDEELNIESISEILRDEGYTVITAKNGLEAIKAYNQHLCPVVLTDLKMPDYDGYYFIEEVNKLPDPPLIIVETMVKDVGDVISLMKKNVYDYIIKPFSLEELTITINRAWDFFELKHIKKIVEKEMDLRIENQINWDVWQQNVVHKDLENNKKFLFENLRTNFSQGAGFGTLLSTIDLIKDSSTADGDFIKIDKSIMEFLYQNADVTRRILDRFHEINSIMNDSLNFELVSVEKLYSLLEELKSTLYPFSSIKKQAVKISQIEPKHSDYTLSLNKELFYTTMKELLINAFKFSESNSEIFILLEVFGKNFVISLLNSPIPDSNKNVGIKEEYSRIIFEPFYRLSKLVFEEYPYPSLDFGLGLTLVDKVIRRHNGMISAFNIMSHIGSQSKEMVNFQISLPIYR